MLKEHGQKDTVGFWDCFRLSVTFYDTKPFQLESEMARAECEKWNGERRQERRQTAGKVNGGTREKRVNYFFSPWPPHSVSACPSVCLSPRSADKIGCSCAEGTRATLNGAVVSARHTRSGEQAERTFAVGFHEMTIFFVLFCFVLQAQIRVLLWWQPIQLTSRLVWQTVSASKRAFRLFNGTFVLLSN